MFLEMNAVDEEAVTIDCVYMRRPTDKSDRSARPRQHASEITSDRSRANHSNPGPGFFRHAISKILFCHPLRSEDSENFTCHPERSEGSPNARSTLAVQGISTKDSL